jgi:Major Facilitator Superfamily
MLSEAAASPRGEGAFHRTGFVLALILRLLTASLAILIPLYVSDALGVAAGGVGVYVLALWVGNGAGVALAMIVIRRQSVSSVGGFLVLGGALYWMAFAQSDASALISSLAAGVGMGLAQPFLFVLMHLDSPAENPFSGVGLYSVALALGLVLGPLLASGCIYALGFRAALSVLALLALCGGVLAAVRAASKRGTRGENAAHPFSPRLMWRAFRNARFVRAFLVNLSYSFVLPVFLSYGAVYASARFGLGSSEALLVFSGAFLLSAAFRAVAVKFRGSLGPMLVVSAAALVVSMPIMGLAGSVSLFVVGAALFSVPHAFILPITSFDALSSVDGETVVNASYAFQASSGVAEILTPAVAVAVVAAGGLAPLFTWSALVALPALVLSLPLWRREGDPPAPGGAEGAKSSAGVPLS